MVAMRVRRAWPPTFAAVTLLSLSAFRSYTQSGTPAPRPAKIIRANANLVLVDVVVTADGQPVDGLAKQRFHVFEDGREQTITSFEEHRASDAPVVAPAPALPPHVYSNDPQFDLSSAANVLLLDALNTPLTDQQYVRRQMIVYLKGIAPGTRIAVFTLASQLRMIAGFATDAGTIEAAIRGSRAARQSPLLETPEEKEQDSDVASSMSPFDGGAMQQFLADKESFQMDLRVRTTLDALGELGRYLNGIPGRKNLIWFSGSFPLQIAPNPALDPTSASSPMNLFSPEREYSEQIQQTDALLTAARVAMYPVDARGLMNLVSVDTSQSFAGSPFPSAGEGQRRTEMGPTSRVQQKNNRFLQTETDEHQTMQQMAVETGGEAFYNTNGLKEAVAEAIRNGSNYYTLGYVPQDANWDGSFRRIEVRVDGGKYELSYRRGYYADNPLKPGPETPGVASPIVAALERGAPPLSVIRFEVRVLAANDPEAKAVKPQPGPAGVLAAQLKPPVLRYLVDLSVDPHGMEWSALPGNVAHAEIEVAMVAWDADGRRVNYTDHAFAINLNPQQSALVLRSGLPAHQEIDLPAGEMYLRIAVHDLRNGRIGSLEVPLMVGKIQEISPRRN
jgi:VWFA-related protein